MERNNLALTNFILLDGTEHMVPVTGKTILIREGRIAEILETKSLTPTERSNIRRNYRLINLQGKYLMPGLVNLHVHLALSGKPPKASAKTKPVNYKLVYKLMSGIAPVHAVTQSIVAHYAKIHLLSGSTTIRTVGGVLDFDSCVRDAINAGKLTGPRILCANMAVTVPGGHFAGSLAIEASSPEECAAAVDRVAATHPDLIKLMITGGVMDCKVVGEPGILRMPPELVKACCDEAHRLGYPVAAHVESPEGVRVALENGVDTIEHGGKPDAEMIDLFRKTGSAMICTVSPALPYALFDRNVSHCSEEAQINGRIIMEGGIACTKACLAAGVPVGIGTDSSCPFITHYDMWRELVYFHHYCGASNRRALHTATLGNATIAGIADETGSITCGKSADLIVTARNPLEDLKALRKVNLVVCRGKVYEEPKVKKMKQVEEALDQWLPEE